MEEQLKQSLSLAIDAFGKNRAEILSMAYTAGGQEAVRKSEDGFDELRNAYFELLKKQLDKNNALYNQLMTNAKEEAEKLNTSITKLNNINDIMGLVSSSADLTLKIVSLL